MSARGRGMAGFVVAALLAVGCTQMSETRSAGKSTDMFLASAARASEAEAELSRLALERSRDRRVREFAQRVIDDHQRMNQQIQKLAAQKGMTVTTEPDAMHQQVATDLSKLSGEEFDREYMTEMLGDHAKMLTKFENKARQARDPQIQEWAAKQVPKFREHYQIAQSINERLIATR